MDNSNKLISNSICLRVSLFSIGNERKLSSDMVDTGSVDKSRTKHVKLLFGNNPRYRAIKNAKHQLRSLLSRYCVRTPIFDSSAHIVPLTLVETVDSKLVWFRGYWDDLVDKFVEEYPNMINEAELQLGDAFDRKQFPSVDIIRSYFEFRYEYVVMDSLPQVISQISMDIFDRERERAKRKYEKVAVEIESALYTGFQEIVDNLIQRLQPDSDGKRKIIPESTLNNFNDFLAILRNKNLTDEDGINKLIDQTQKLMSGIDVKQLRREKPIRDVVLNGLSEVGSILNQAVVKRTRKIELN